MESLHESRADLNEFYALCEHASDPSSWEDIKQWILSNPDEEARYAAELLGDTACSPLHLVCQHKPPFEIVELLMILAPHTVEWTDIYGWLPLHHACANGSSDQVISFLIDNYPQSVRESDKKCRTPLHFALNLHYPASPISIERLVSFGATKLSDENGLLPLHYATAYGSSEEVVRCLILDYPDSIHHKDRKNRIPLHYALGNADKPSSPAVVKLLITLYQDTSNFVDKEGNLPIHLLSKRASSILKEEGRDNCEKCIRMYLSARPNPTADFLTAIQSFPEWLRDVAVLTPIIQEYLNKKISRRFPTAVLLLDFYFLMLSIIFFTLGVNQSIDIRYPSPGDVRTEVDGWIILALVICSVYFITREMVQIFSLMGIGLFKTWLNDPTNWLDCCCIILLINWTLRMYNNSGDDEIFRYGTCLSMGVFWTSTLSYLKSINIEFAIFVSLVIYVVKNLVAFFITTLVFLFAFAQIFHTYFIYTPTFCPGTDDDIEFCNLPDAFIKCLDFMLGSLDDTLFSYNNPASFFFMLFVFLVVLILCTVNIAIITDIFTVISGERAETVFWTNRLDFVAETDVIMNGKWKKKLVSFLFPDFEDIDDEFQDDQENFLRNFWDILVGVYEDGTVKVFSVDFWTIIITRIFVAIVICFFIIPLGLITAGSLWPPQIREYIFDLKSTGEGTEEAHKPVEQEESAVKELMKEADDLRELINLNMMKNRKTIAGLKTNIKDLEEDMKDELEKIRQAVLTFYENELRNQN